MCTKLADPELFGKQAASCRACTVTLLGSCRRYDTNVKTILEGVTFRNYRWKGDGSDREAVWVTMTHSDKCGLALSGSVARSGTCSYSPPLPRCRTLCRHWHRGDHHREPAWSL